MYGVPVGRECLAGVATSHLPPPTNFRTNLPCHIPSVGRVLFVDGVAAKMSRDTDMAANMAAMCYIRMC